MGGGGAAQQSLVEHLAPLLDTRQLAVRGLAAASTALVVAPLIACFDEAITRASNGSENVWVVLAQRLRTVASHPVQFVASPAFRWVWMVYAATYFAANLVQPLSIGFAATVLVTLVNMTCGIAKDAAYATMFQQQQEIPNSNRRRRRPKKTNELATTTTKKSSSTPLSALLVWFARDLVSFTFVLTLPELISQAAPKLDLRLTKFATPVVAQYFTTPLHLLGLSLVNDNANSSDTNSSSGSSNSKKTVAQHLKAAVGGSYFSTVTARQLRIIPPYSVGGLLNGWILGSLLMDAPSSSSSSSKASSAAAPAP